MVHRFDNIHIIRISTTCSCIRCIDKTGPLLNVADRDHYLQYSVAVALLYDTLAEGHYTDAVAQDPRIDTLRRKMNVLEILYDSADYLDPEKRSVPNAIQVNFNDHTSKPMVALVRREQQSFASVLGLHHSKGEV